LFSIMYYVYCLVSEKNPKFHYYGFTSNLKKRLLAHKNNKVRTTRRFSPVKLLGYKTFFKRNEALKYEKDLKTKASYRRSFIKDITLTGSPAFMTAYKVRQACLRDCVSSQAGNLKVVRSNRTPATNFLFITFLQKCCFVYKISHSNV